MIQLPLTVVRREPTALADAFLVRATDAGPLADAVARLGPTTVFRVAGGFLVVPPDPTGDRPPGTVRLRRLRGDLFTPADADLRPALLPDEQTALTRAAGLVLLPGGERLAFDPARPLTAADWLRLPTVRHGGWEPLPAPGPLADRLTRVERPTVDVPVELLLGGGRPADARPLPGHGEGGPVPADARPPAGGPLDRAAAGANLLAGRLLAALGRLVRSPGLARRGADLVRQAIERVPRLSESVLGAQEAALREVLRQLQGGDVEQALRRAPVAVADPAGGGRVDAGSRLTARNPLYSLRDLLGGSGPGAGWLGGGDVWAKLAAEYRRLADAAVRRGDYRRAAYLHGVLLRDVRAAAGVLQRGGLHRDAAVLLRDKLHDLPAAARAFEQAGDADEAVRLFVRAGLDEAAGDLLLTLGLADRAAERFRAAADKLAKQGRWAAAGDLLRTRLGDRAAGGCYLRGWESAGPEAAACGERLFDWLASERDWAGVRKLAAAAGAVLAPPRTGDAGRFFNHARAASGLPADLRAEVADQGRVLFAAHLRAAPAAGRAADALFAGWPGEVARDAAFAARGRATAPDPPPAAAGLVRLVDGSLTAAAVARQAGGVAVAAGGRVVYWRPDDGRVLPVARTGAAVVGLAVTPFGRKVYVLRGDGGDLVLGLFALAGDRFEYRTQRRFPNAARPGQAWALGPVGVTANGEPRLFLDVLGLRLGLTDADLLTRPGESAAAGPADLRIPAPGGGVWEWVGNTLLLEKAAEPTHGWVAHWTPFAPDGLPAADWLTPSPRRLELVGTDRNGMLHWGEWWAAYTDTAGSKHAATSPGVRYRSACLLGPRRVAAVTADNHVHWLRVNPAGGSGLTPTAPPLRLGVPSSAAVIVARPAAGEALVLFEDGSGLRLPAAG